MLGKLSDTIELVDRDYPNKIENRKSIRLKTDTYQKTFSFWERFLQWRLENAKEKLLNTTVTTNEIERSGDKESHAEKKILKRTTAIARLEEKLDILPNDVYGKKESVENRAIKLKDKMMKNLSFHAGSAYSIPEEVKEDFFDKIEKEVKQAEAPKKEFAEKIEEEKVEEKSAEIPETSTPVVEDSNNKIEEKELSSEVNETADKIIEEAMATTAESVQEIIRENDVIVTPDRDEIQKIVDNEFAAKEESVVQPEIKMATTSAEAHEEIVNEMNEEDIKADLDAEFEMKNISKNSQRAAKVNVEVEEVNENEIKEAIDEALTNNEEIKPEKVNKFINDDGTYALKREDMDEDFRKTVIEPRIPVMPKVEIPKVSLDDILIRKENFVEDIENKFETENAEETIVSSEQQLDLEEQEDIISAIEEQEENVRLDYQEDIVTPISKEEMTDASSKLADLMKRYHDSIQREKEASQIENEAAERLMQSQKKLREGETAFEAFIRSKENESLERYNKAQQSVSQSEEEITENDRMLAAMLEIMDQEPEQNIDSQPKHIR